MLKIGIAGGIGSGKSTVCRLFSFYGAPVYDSDERTKQLMDTDPALKSAIQTLLGKEAYKEGRLDRKWVAGKIFPDDALRENFENIVHPAVAADFQRWEKGQTGPYCILESAILFESGFDAQVDRTIAISAPENLRIERTVRRDGCFRETVRQRIKAQIDDEARSRLADYTIINDERHSLIEQVAAIDQKLRNE